MKERQYQRAKSWKLPHAVHYQCIWLIRDMERLRVLAANPEPSPAAAEARFRLDCIQLALQEVPEFYRDGIIGNIRGERSGYGEHAHLNTWKRWKQIFLYELALDLRLIAPD